NNGWHPMMDENSWTTPMVFVGNGIAQQRVLPYFEHTDLMPTILWLLGIQKVDGKTGQGRVIEAIKEGNDLLNYNHPQYIKIINEQIKQYSILHAKLTLASENNLIVANFLASLNNQNLTLEPFYHQDRILDWYK